LGSDLRSGSEREKNKKATHHDYFIAPGGILEMSSRKKSSPSFSSSALDDIPSSNHSKYQSLILRNEQLAAEIIKIRSKNMTLKKELQKYQRKQFSVTYETKSTQTSPKVRSLDITTV
jgi:hypothetical protein